MKNQLIKALESLTRFRLGMNAGGEAPAALHFLLIRMAAGVIFALIALFVLWGVKNPLIASCLGTLVLVGLHRYVWRENEDKTPMVLLRQWSRIVPGQTGTDDFTYYQAVAGYCLGLRPLLLFLLLYSGCWYWIFPVYALGGAIALDTMEGDSISTDTRMSLWGTAIVSSILVTLLMNSFCHPAVHAVLTVVLVSIVAWLLPSWLKRIPFEKMSSGSYFYMGEMVVLLALLCGIAL